MVNYLCSMKACKVAYCILILIWIQILPGLMDLLLKINLMVSDAYRYLLRFLPVVTYPTIK